MEVLAQLYFIHELKWYGLCPVSGSTLVEIIANIDVVVGNEGNLL